MPIFRDTFWPSEARTCGEFMILALVSLSIACSKAPGRDVEKSLVDRCARRPSVKFEPGVVVVVEVGVVVDGVVDGVVVLGVVVVV